MSNIPDALRHQVIERARDCCEYCRLARRDNFFPHEVDHIIAEKHRGRTVFNNLCLSCIDCNRHKGSDIASIDEDTGAVTTLFNPRIDRWEEHFRLEGAQIVGLTPEGRVTVFLLAMNDTERVAKRARLSALKRYPCNPAPSD